MSNPVPVDDSDRVSSGDVSSNEHSSFPLADDVADCPHGDGNVDAAFQAAVRRCCSWRVPPNWSVSDWREESRAVALIAEWQAKLDYNPLLAVPLAAFVFGRVSARVLTRSRQEWRYALRVSPADEERIEILGGLAPDESTSGSPFEALSLALEKLPEAEHWLLEQLFWKHRTEASIAEELHISQPAINKRKKLALIHLRELL